MEMLRPLNDPAFAAKSVAFTGTAGTTANWPPGAQGVLLWSTTDAYVRVGVGITATTADTPLPAYTPVAFHAPQTENLPWQVSAIQISAGGTLYAKPLAIR